jgi:hypothetical protein
LSPIIGEQPGLHRETERERERRREERREGERMGGEGRKERRKKERERKGKKKGRKERRGRKRRRRRRKKNRREEKKNIKMAHICHFLATLYHLPFLKYHPHLGGMVSLGTNLPQWQSSGFLSEFPWE